MTSTLFRRFAMALAIAAALSASACSKKTKTEDSSVPNAASADENSSGDSDSGRAMGLKSVNFAYDAFVLTSEAKSTLKSNADILKGNGGVKIQVEGHCDQHGGIQYNIALGEKRANAVKKYLQDLGVAGDRITTISFGKERPLDTANTPAADAKNRRANFVITSH
jgi:peptidoglycan-associated lipoprotein